MATHVSIHDVSPFFRDEVELALEKCHAVSVRPALLVVPDFHAKAPLLGDAAFCARLRALQREGHEIYLHGFFHESRKARPGASARDLASHALYQRVVSGGEAEFRDVDAREAEERLDQGWRVLEDAGLRVDGFVAPAWAMPPWLVPMLGARGCHFTEDHTTIYDPARGRARASVVLNFASRSPARLFSTVAYCRAARVARALLPARVAIHPADMRFALLRHEVDSLLAWASRDAVPRGADLWS